MNVRDYIGERGESIFKVRLTDFCGNPVPYFAAYYLGEKCPTFDYLVELVNAGSPTPYFFVQVKSTARRLNLTRSKLAIGVSPDDVQRMVACPIPTYLVGVHAASETAYILSVHGARKTGISSMTTQFPLNPANLKRLWDEVRTYWATLDASRKTSQFA